ncbi:MAG TPA: type I-E CRISPR-associated protein Cse1/CasA, partial [Armatimonadota bacterium]|nr:type I-E CRISPR-associated protein Cse1/CasA [Armatimonadota bacterium]
MKASFNLTREPWIPCVPLKGNTVEELGIADVLCNAHQLREIHHDSPLVTVSLYRLLLAVLYRACGPSSFTDNEHLWRDGKFPADVIDRYLHSRWKDRFDLFNEAYPFFQTADLEMKKKDSLARLATELASGNNA